VLLIFFWLSSFRFIIILLIEIADVERQHQLTAEADPELPEVLEVRLVTDETLTEKSQKHDLPRLADILLDSVPFWHLFNRFNFPISLPGVLVFVKGKCQKNVYVILTDSEVFSGGVQRINKTG
jgi:hypothetical protein